MMSRKSQKSLFKGLTMSFMILSVIITLCGCSPSFDTYPDYRIYTGGYQGTAVKVSTDNRYVMAGFTNGNAKIYYTSGSLYASCNGHNQSIVDIEQIPYNGWITLDASGVAIRWSTYGVKQYTWNFSTYATDISVAGNGGYYYVAFNFGSSILEYNALTNSNTTTRTYYTPSTYAYFKKIQYSSTYSYLYAATNTSYVYQYDCYTGNYSSTSLYTYYPATDMDIVPGGNKQIVLLNNNYILNFKNTSSTTMVSYSEYADLVAASYAWNGDTIYILANSNTSSNLYIHTLTGYLRQTLSNTYTIKAIDATNTYLCALDMYGYLIIYSYSSYDPDDYVPSSFPVVAIILMSIFLPFIFVGLIICIAVRAKKRRQAQMVNNYNRFNNEPVNPQYFPNNQPIIPPPSGQQYSGNSINPQPNQPAWSSNSQPQPYFNTYTQPYQPPVQPPVQQNPYQANQPSNWS